MRISFLILSLASLILICSCASTPEAFNIANFTSPGGIKSSEKLSDLTLEQRTQLNKSLNDVMKICLSNLGTLQDKSEKQINNTSWWLISAIIASGIVSPALLIANAHANAVYVVAVNGYSATATYIAKNNESTNQSGAFIAANHDNIITELQKDMDSVNGTNSTVGDVENLMVKMNSECTLVPIGVPAYTPAPAAITKH